MLAVWAGMSMWLSPASVIAQGDPCWGDCSGDGVVSVDELVDGVRIALGLLAPDACRRADADGDGRVAIDELLRAVAIAFSGCRSEPAPTARRESPTATPEQPSPPPTATPSKIATATPTSTAPPNIILINLDDVRADGVDRMPVLLSRIAAEGVQFRNAFVNNALCAPSRASLLTGLYALHHGTRTLTEPQGGAYAFHEHGSDRETIAVWLHAAGYRTGLFGKYINGYLPTANGPAPDPTFDLPPGWDRWLAMLSPENYGGVLGLSYVLADEGGALTRYDDHGTDAQYSTDVTGTALQRFVSQAAAAHQPFFAMWAPYAAHADEPSPVPAPAERHFGLFDELPAWRPPNWNEADRSDKPRWLRARRSTGFLLGVTDLIRRRAYESLLSVDEQLAALLDVLAEEGVDQNTVVIVTSDNGSTWGEHRLWGQAKQCPYEECLRVPLLVRDPRFASARGVRDTAVVTVDLPVTVAALAGVTPPAGRDGANCADWIGGPPAGRSDFLIEHWRDALTDSLGQAGQVADGDQVRLIYGDSTPPASSLFEFDIGDGVAADALPVAIGADADASLGNLGVAVETSVPNTRQTYDAANRRLTIRDTSAAQAGVYWVVEKDQAGVLAPSDDLPGSNGVRDVAHGYTYVEYDSGERELYDLTADPWQLDNQAENPDYEPTRTGYASRLQALLRGGS